MLGIPRTSWVTPSLSRFRARPSPHLLTRAHQPAPRHVSTPRRGFSTPPRSISSPLGARPHPTPHRFVAPARRPFGTTNPRGRPLSTSRASRSEIGGQEPQTLGARMRKMSREYGWTALGVYLGLSVLDFPLCFMLVRFVGTDKIGQIEHLIVSTVSRAIPDMAKEAWRRTVARLKGAEEHALGDNDVSHAAEMAGWGVEEAEERNRTEASLGTQLALAYAVHKSFIFVRVPLTAAVLPKVVKLLRSWGWQVGKRKL